MNNQYVVFMNAANGSETAAIAGVRRHFLLADRGRFQQLNFELTDSGITIGEPFLVCLNIDAKCMVRAPLPTRAIVAKPQYDLAHYCC